MSRISIFFTTAGLIICSTLVSPIAKAETTEKSVSILFPLEKSNVHSQAQKFEYQILSDGKIKLGNTLIDQRRFSLKILRGANKYYLAAQWPAAAISDGSLVLKDNTGKLIWNQPLKSSRLKITRQEEQGLKADYGTAARLPIDNAAIQQMQVIPFFRFCVQKDEAPSTASICSAEYFYRRGQGLQRRKRAPTETYVEVNGQIVSGAGSVYLQSTKQTLSLRAVMSSGWLLEVFTRMKEIDFKDFTLSNDEQKLMVTASGSEPVDSKTIVKRGLVGWTVAVDAKQPYLYVRGEGDIPLRQEFNIQGPLRKNDMQYIWSEIPDAKTYSSSVSGTLKTPKNVELLPIDENSKLERQSDSEWTWSLENLERGKNRRYIKVSQSGKELFGAWDTYRGRPFEASLKIYAPWLWMEGQFNQYFTQRFGWSATYDFYVMKKDASEPRLSFLAADFIYRLEPGMLGEDPSPLLKVGVISFNVDGTSVLALTAGGEYNFSSPSLYSEYFSMTSLRGRLGLLSTSDVKLGQAWDIEIAAQRPWRTYQWEVGLRLQSFKFKDSVGDQGFWRYGLMTGLGFHF